MPTHFHGRFKPSRKNRLDHFPDGFFQFLDGLKPSRN
jgi:hypothetical protein